MINYNQELLNSLVQDITRKEPTINKTELVKTISGILSLYEIKPATLPGVNPDINDKAKLFLSSKKLEGLSKLTLESYKLDLKIFGNYINKPVSDITTNDIRLFLSQFNNLKMSSISKKLSVLKSFFSWLVDEEIITKNPTKKIKPPKVEKKIPKALNIEEFEMLRESCVTFRERAILEVYYATGCRLSEVQKLNIKDINFQTLSTKVIGKGNKEREVFISWKAAFHLNKYLNSRQDNHEALFITEKFPVNRLSNRGIQREVKDIAKRANLDKNVHVHVLRHTMATLMLNNNADISTVQAILGHSKPDTTQVYAQLTNEKKKENYKKYLVQ